MWYVLLSCNCVLLHWITSWCSCTAEPPAPPPVSSSATSLKYFNCKHFPFRECWVELSLSLQWRGMECWDIRLTTDDSVFVFTYLIFSKEKITKELWCGFLSKSSIKPGQRFQDKNLCSAKIWSLKEPARMSFHFHCSGAGGMFVLFLSLDILCVITYAAAGHDSL